MVFYFIQRELEKEGIRVEIDDSSEKIGYKIRLAQIDKIPYSAVIGNKEIENQSFSVRRYGEQKSFPFNFDALKAIIKQ